MKFVLAYNYVVAAALIVVYLAIPATIVAHAATMEGGFPSAQVAASTVAAAPCGDCPCSDGQGSDCCDSSFCSCACHAPLSQSLRIIYAPVIARQSFMEPSRSFPQVCRPIFVPPQNQV